MKNRSNLAIFTTMLSVLACIGLAYGAVGPETPDPSPRPINSNTADGYRAVENSDNNFNSGFGWFSLFSNTDAFFNSGFGAATLFFNSSAMLTAARIMRSVIKRSLTTYQATSTQASVMTRSLAAPALLTRLSVTKPGVT